MILNDICELIVDCPHSTAKDERSGYPLIRTPNIGRGRLILDDVHRVSKEVYDKRNARAIPQDDDLILAREAPAGNIAIIKNGEKVCLGQRTVLIRPDKKKVYPDFLAYYILAPQQQYELLGTANGATVAHVNIPMIKALPVELPDLEVQQKVADILKAYDDLIENNQRQIKLLEESAQRLYKEWFVDLRFPGCEGMEIVDGVPEGWHKGILSEIVEFRRGKTITKARVKEGSVPVVAGGLEPAYYHNVANTNAPVITVSGSGANAGYSRLYYEDVFASDCSYADIKGTNYIYYIYCFLKANKYQLDALQKGSAQPHVYAKDINAMEMLIPMELMIKTYCDKTEAMFKTIGQLQKQNANAAEARDRLLPKLMSGEIEL
ncbi:MAG: restriction endonuclease subunit S [Oliverpabstia sp.]